MFDEDGEEGFMDYFGRCYFGGAAFSLGMLTAALVVLGIFKAVHAAVGLVF